MFGQCSAIVGQWAFVFKALFGELAAETPSQFLRNRGAKRFEQCACNCFYQQDDIGLASRRVTPFSSSHHPQTQFSD
jgi:hypothetical protein